MTDPTHGQQLPLLKPNSPLNIALRAAGLAGVTPWIGKDGRWRIEVHQDQLAEMVGAVLTARDDQDRTNPNPAPTPDALDQAHAAGYAAAVANLRDDRTYGDWWHTNAAPEDFVAWNDRRHLVKYLEAVGAGVNRQSSVDSSEELTEEIDR